MIRALLVALAIGPAALAQSFDDLARVPPPYPYDIDFDNHLLHLHPEVNYAPHPDWLAAWERDRLGHGGVLGTFGSTAVDELLVDARWALNPDLGSGVRLRNDILWQEWRHLPHERQQIWLGLEQRLWRGLGAVIQAVPAEDKEWIDVRLGGLWASPDRRQYVQLLYRRDEIVHDSKSERGGTTIQRPEGVDWLLRLARGEWSLYSRGRWLREADRVYDDPARAPVIAGHRYAGNEALVRLRWRPVARAQLELAWRLVEDAQTRTYRGDATAYDHEFSGRYRTLGLRGLLPLDRRWRLRGELHHVARRVAVTGWRPLRHARDEWLPAIVVERRWNERSWLELGYLGTFYGYTDTARGDDRDDGAKLELGAVVGLEAGSALKASLSHQVTRGRFGGFNLRLITWF
ncbi:hypothetical protein GF314_11850 [bacterium]|nr:hypothetical protein [bacterium]